MRYRSWDRPMPIYHLCKCRKINENQFRLVLKLIRTDWLSEVQCSYFDNCFIKITLLVYFDHINYLPEPIKILLCKASVFLFLVTRSLAQKLFIGGGEKKKGFLALSHCRMLGWQPYFGTQYSVFFYTVRSTQRQYAVCRNSVMSNQTSNFTLKRSHFHHETKHRWHKVKLL